MPDQVEAVANVSSCSIMKIVLLTASPGSRAESDGHAASRKTSFTARCASGCAVVHKLRRTAKERRSVKLAFSDEEYNKLLADTSKVSESPIWFFTLCSVVLFPISTFSQQ